MRIVDDVKKNSKSNRRNNDYNSDEETKEGYSEESDEDLDEMLEGLNDDDNAEIRELLDKLATLQRKYKDTDFDDIPENDQYLIKVT